MPRFVHSDVQYASIRHVSTYLREINVRFRNLISAFNQNREESFNYMTLDFAGNVLQRFGVTIEGYLLTRAGMVCDVGSGTIDIDIDTVSVGGAPFACSTTSQLHEITSPNETSQDSMSIIEITPSGLGGSATGIVTLQLKRIS